MAQGVVLPVQEIPSKAAPAIDAGVDAGVDAVSNAVDHPLLHEFLKAVATKPEHIFMWFMLLALLIVWVSLLWSWHSNKSNNVNLQDLIMINNKLDESKMNRFIAFVVSTWGFVFLLVTGQFTDWYFMGYMAAWVSNALFSNYLRQRDKNIDLQYRLEREKLSADSGEDDTGEEEEDPASDPEPSGGKKK